MNAGIKELAATRQQEIRQCLGNRVRLLRFQRRWTQEVLAEIAGLHRNYIGHIERAEVNVGLKNMHQLAQAFAMTVSEFLEGV